MVILNVYLSFKMFSEGNIFDINSLSLKKKKKCGKNLLKILRNPTKFLTGIKRKKY